MNVFAWLTLWRVIFLVDFDFAAVLTFDVFPLVNVLADLDLVALVEAFLTAVFLEREVLFATAGLVRRVFAGAAFLAATFFFGVAFDLETLDLGFALVPVDFFAGVFFFEAVFAEADFVFFLAGTILPPCNGNSLLFCEIISFH